MSTSKRKSAAPVVIDCENCHHYKGLYYAGKFECAKGHAQEKVWTLKRAQCADFSPMTRDEQILKRFQHGAQYRGDEDIKKHRSEVRRMVTGIRKTIDSFGKFMTADQIDAMNAAAKHLAALGNDLEHAGERANRIQRQATAEREKQEKARRAALVASTIGDMPESAVVALCADLSAFDTFAARDWLRQHKNNPKAFVSMHHSCELLNGIAHYRQTPGAAQLATLKEYAALCIDELKGSKYSRDYATLADFESFRARPQEGAPQ